MSGRGRGGRGGVSSTRGAATPSAARGKLDLNTRSGSRSPARAGRRESPARGSPQYRGVASGARGATSRSATAAAAVANSNRGGRGAAAAARGGKYRGQPVKQAVVSEQPKSVNTASADIDTKLHINVRKTKMPKIKDNPEAPEMSDMDDIRTSKVDLLVTSSDEETLNNGTGTDEESPAAAVISGSNGHSHTSDGTIEESEKSAKTVTHGEAEAKNGDALESLKHDPPMDHQPVESEISSDAPINSDIIGSNIDHKKVVNADKAATVDKSDTIEDVQQKVDQKGDIKVSESDNKDTTDDVVKNVETEDKCDDNSSALISAKDQESELKDQSLIKHLQSDPTSTTTTTKPNLTPPAISGDTSNKNMTVVSTAVLTVCNSVTSNVNVKSNSQVIMNITSASDKASTGDKATVVDINTTEPVHVVTSVAGSCDGINDLVLVSTPAALATSDDEHDNSESKDNIADITSELDKDPTTKSDPKIDKDGEIVISCMEIGDAGKVEVSGYTDQQQIQNVTPITLDKLSSGMVPVSSALIEHMDQDAYQEEHLAQEADKEHLADHKEADEKDGARVKSIPLLSSLELGDVPLDQVPVLLCNQVNGQQAFLPTSPVKTPSSDSDSEGKPKLVFDKSKLFTKMNDIFAKDTQETIKKIKKKERLSAAKLSQAAAITGAAANAAVNTAAANAAANTNAGAITTTGKDLPKIAKDVRQKEVKTEESSVAVINAAPVKPVVNECVVVDNGSSAMVVDETALPDLTVEADNLKPLATGNLLKPEPMQTDEDDFPEPPVLEKQVEDLKPPVLEPQHIKPLSPLKSAINQSPILSPVKKQGIHQFSPILSHAMKPASTIQSPILSPVKQESLLKVVLTSAASPKKPRSRKNSLEITTPTETPLSAMPESMEVVEMSKVTPQPTSTTASDLTKSLRKVRLNKKSPTKQLSKDGLTLNNTQAPPPQITSMVQGAGPILAPIPVSSNSLLATSLDATAADSQGSRRSSPQSSNPVSPSKPVGGGGSGTEIFDFTDDEDIPLNHIDIEALNEAEKARNSGSNLLITGAIMSSEPLEISIPDHHTIGSGAVSSTPPHSKSPGKRYSVSPTILSADDALAAVMAVHQHPYTPTKLQFQMANGDLMSDDTDTSVTRTADRSALEHSRPRLGKRKKRRPMESDGGDTEDDFDHPPSKSRSDVARPKRSKHQQQGISGGGAANSTEAPQHITRPSSAASSTASTRELDERRLHEGGEDGKLSPDSHKSSDEKASVKGISTVVPEKASSFKIHPERTCADCCYYCGLKFGMLDTPLHIQQLKTQEKQEFAMEFTKFGLDACLCDRCFRFLDRRAAARDMSKPGVPGLAGGKAGTGSTGGGGDKEEKVKKCLIRTCNRIVTGSVSKKWLNRLKKRLVKKVTLDWDRVAKASVNATFLLCAKHSSLIDFYSTCGLCKRKLSVGAICTLGMSKKDVEDMNILLREDNIPADLKENNFVCKLCKTFCGIKQKSLQADYLKNHKTHKAFYKDYRRRLYAYLELGDTGEELTQVNPQNHNKPNDKLPKKMFKVSQSTDEGSCKIKISAHTLDSAAGAKTPTGGGGKRNRKEKDFASPSSESKLHVSNYGAPDYPADDGASNNDKCAVNIQFDMNTKKLWQDLHYPYGNYTSFFRHLILLEKYWRSGDLVLAQNSSLKSSAYLKSVQNRINAYEGKQCVEDLSANTRPNLESPAAPTLTHVPGEEVLANLPTDNMPSPVIPSPSPSPSGLYSNNSTILRIPRVSSSLLSPTNSILSPESLELTKANANHPSSKTGSLRVRQDLMNHLGLIPRPVPQSSLVVSSSGPPAASTYSSHLVPSSVTSLLRPTSITPIKVTSQGLAPATTSSSLVLTPSTMRGMLNSTPTTSYYPTHYPTAVITPASSSMRSSLTTSTTPNLAKLLQDTNTTYSVEDKVVTGIKSSNSQLFKGSENTGAIPLTFNNSIAEVLAAAAGKTKLNKSREPSPKPEITITAKNSKFGGTASSIEALTKITKKNNQAASIGALTAGGLSIQKKPMQQNSTINPITNMAKLLQSQAPGLPPHIIAQQTMPLRPGGATYTTSIRPTSTGLQVQPLGSKNPQPRVPSQATFRPVQLGAGKVAGGIQGGIQTVNKKSLTTVLDRLNHNPGTTATSISPTKSMHNASMLSSSLVQQLQAPLANQTGQQQLAGGMIPANITLPANMAITAMGPANSGSSTLRAQLSRSPALSVTPMSVAATMSSTLPGNIIVPSSLTISSSTAPLNLPPGIQLPSSIQLTPSMSQLGQAAGPLLQFAAGGPGVGPGGPPGQPLEQFLFPNMNQNMAAQAAAFNSMMASLTGLTPQQAAEILQAQQQLVNQEQQRIRGPPPLKNMGRKPN